MSLPFLFSRAPTHSIGRAGRLALDNGRAYAALQHVLCGQGARGRARLSSSVSGQDSGGLDGANAECLTGFLQGSRSPPIAALRAGRQASHRG